MSHSHPTPKPSNFRLTFDGALKAYKYRTKLDPLTHPLANRLEPCDSVSGILAVLQEHIQERNQSQRNNGKWLDPTVNGPPRQHLQSKRLCTSRFPCSCQRIFRRGLRYSDQRPRVRTYQGYVHKNSTSMRVHRAASRLPKGVSRSS